jgi:hypothetical protein
MPTLPFVVVPTAFSSISANTAGAANPATHLGEFDTVGMTWKSAVSLAGFGNAQISGDFGSAKSVDFVAVLQATAEAGMSWLVELSNAADFSTTVFSSGIFAPFIGPAITRADGLYNSHMEITPVSARYWRVTFSGQSGFLEASMVVIGKKVTPANYYSPGFGYGVNDLGAIDVGRYGVPDLTPGKIFRTLDFTLGWTSESDFETKFRPLVEALGKTKPALWCFDPTANVYRQARTYMGWLTNQLVAQHQANTPDGPRFKQDFSILSMF